MEDMKFMHALKKMAGDTRMIACIRRYSLNFDSYMELLVVSDTDWNFRQALEVRDFANEASVFGHSDWNIPRYADLEKFCNLISESPHLNIFEKQEIIWTCEEVGENLLRVIRFGGCKHLPVFPMDPVPPELKAKVALLRIQE